MSDQTEHLLRQLEEEGVDLSSMEREIASAATASPSPRALPWKASRAANSVFFRYYDRGGGHTAVAAVALDFGKRQIVPTAETVPVEGSVDEVSPMYPGDEVHGLVKKRKLESPPTSYATRYVMLDGDTEKDLWIGTDSGGGPVEATGRDPVRFPGW